MWNPFSSQVLEYMVVWSSLHWELLAGHAGSYGANGENPNVKPCSVTGNDDRREYSSLLSQAQFDEGNLFNRQIFNT